MTSTMTSWNGKNFYRDSWLRSTFFIGYPDGRRTGSCTDRHYEVATSLPRKSNATSPHHKFPSRRFHICCCRRRDRNGYRWHQHVDDVTTNHDGDEKGKFIVCLVHCIDWHGCCWFARRRRRYVRGSWFCCDRRGWLLQFESGFLHCDCIVTHLFFVRCHNTTGWPLLKQVGGDVILWRWIWKRFGAIIIIMTHFFNDISRTQWPIELLLVVSDWEENST